MIDLLRIKNFALIEEAELEFCAGLNVFTGESGAGKSIIMGALELLIGGRATKDIIRHGCSRSEVSGIFLVPDNIINSVTEKLKSNDISFDKDYKQLHFRRVITNNSVRNYINDSSVSAKFLKEIGEELVDCHGANEQLTLLSPIRQLSLLDRYANVESLRKNCEKTYNEILSLQAEKNDFMENLPNEDEKNRLELVLEDIQKINPAPDEDTQLTSRYQLAAGSRDIIESASSIQTLLSDNDNAILDQLNIAYRKLQDLCKIEESIISPLLDDCALIQESVQNFANKLDNLTNSVELDAEELQNMETRLSDLYTIKRRYGPTLEHVFELLEKTQNRLNLYHKTSEKQKQFDIREKKLFEKLKNYANELSAQRKKAALNFSDELKKKLSIIGFAKCEMQIAFDEIEPCATGSDKIEMLFSANAGEDLKPLRKIASSGELSRLMLSFKTVLADADSIPVIIFDEIDVNIGGETANAVGREMHNLGHNRQILAISHLGQVASMADRHFKVEKFEEDGRTISKSIQLNQEEKEKEIARMIGGGDAALVHAKEILKNKKLAY